jgi:hypothetical protein
MLDFVLVTGDKVDMGGSCLTAAWTPDCMLACCCCCRWADQQQLENLCWPLKRVDVNTSVSAVGQVAWESRHATAGLTTETAGNWTW